MEMEREITRTEKDESLRERIRLVLIKANPESLRDELAGHCYVGLSKLIADGLPACRARYDLYHLVYWASQIDMMGHSQITGFLCTATVEALIPIWKDDED